MRDLKKFCETFSCNIPELYGFMAEPGFMEAVIENTVHARMQTAQVIASFLANAQDRTRKDQMKWGVAFLRIVKHPAANDLADFIDDDE